MICPKCGATIADDAKFCGNCGANLASTPPPSAQPIPPGPPVAPAAASPGMASESSSSMQRLIARVKAILLSPATEWQVIEREPSTPADIYKGYVAPLAAICVVASFIGLSLIGIGGLLRVGIVAGLVHAIVAYVLAFVGVF